MPVLKVIGANEAARWLVGTGVKVQAGLGPLVAHHGQVYQGRVRGRVSGRPGLRVITGDYRRGIGLVLFTLEGSPAAAVGTNHPAGRRHELGAQGEDVTGRPMNTPPRPHFEPDFERTANELEQGVEMLVRSAAS